MASQQTFDDLSRLAAQVCDTPMSSISLVEQGRLLVKSRAGFDVEMEKPFCAHVIESRQALIVSDILKDERFSYLPCVRKDQRIRFFAGRPLVTPVGEVLGCICVFDHQSRVPAHKQLDGFEALGRQSGHLLDLSRKSSELEVVSRQLEQELGGRQKAEKTTLQNQHLATVGMLAAAIAHEINNPLAAIRLLVDKTLVLKDSEGGQQAVGDCLSEIAGEVKRAGLVVSSVLQLARQQPSEKQPHDLLTIASRARDHTHLEADKRGVLIELDIPEGLPHPAVNSTEIELVIVNLLTNAIQASPTGTSIKAQAETVGSSVRLTISDEGRGITEEQKAHLFEPLYTTRAGQGGTGLGLSLAHSIVSKHGGAIDVSSRVGGAQPSRSCCLSRAFEPRN